MMLLCRTRRAAVPLLVFLVGAATLSVGAAFGVRPATATRHLSSPLLGTQQGRTGHPTSPRTCNTSLNMFMGSDGGVFGIGAPELATVLLVGYFVLGPSDLYKLTKEIGKFIQNVRTLGSDVTKTFESNLESQLELEELRKAQRELNDAFGFRRSINVDEESEAFTTTSVPSAEAEASVASKSKTKKKKIRRRRVKKPAVLEEQEASASAVVNHNVPDLDVSDVEQAVADTSTAPKLETDAAAAKRREERKERLNAGMKEEDLESAEWVETPEWMKGEEKLSEPSPEERERFAKQLSGDWNEQILASEDKLSPLAKVMERLAILEEEKQAADARLEEEFRLRSQLEEKYYRERRQILEEAAAEVQSNAYVSMSDTGKESEKV